MGEKINIRLARNDEGETIRGLVTRDIDDDFKDFNWTNIEPYWMVAVQGDEIIACLQILVGYPIGIMEFLCFKEGLTQMQKARITKLLITSGFAGLLTSGVSAVVSSVPFNLKSYKKILKKKWGCEVYSSGNLLIKRLV